jgi:ribosomal protein L36
MRVPATKSVETQVLTASQRKCCLCYYLADNRAQRKGQVAHLNKDSSNSEFQNLVWLCLEHHDEFDSKTSQSKGYTSDEIRNWRDRLYHELGADLPKTNDIVIAPNSPSPINQLSPELRNVIQQAGGTLDYLLTPWKLITWHDVRRFLFAYKASNRCDGICEVERLFLRDGRVAVICKQIPENPGNSVTNCIEQIAFQVCDRFKIDPCNLVLIDHYPTPKDFRDSDWSLVSFQRCPPDSMFEGPSWRRMNPDDWRDLGLRPRRKRGHLKIK